MIPRRSPCTTLLFTAPIIAALTACDSPSKSTSTPAAPATAQAAKPAPASTKPTIAPPATTADKPADYPGLHNVVAYGDGFYSGSLPEGDAGFATLEAMGIKTIISVDGAQPDVQAAKAHGLRYVHLPIGYNGMDHDRTLEIARAVKDLPGPTYIHCHHGKHRSAGAAGAAAVTLGSMTPQEATERMKVSGTSPGYTGLYKCVAVAQPAQDDELAAASAVFPEIARTTGLVKTMVEVDEITEHLKLIEKAGWIAPTDHPDLVPAAEAGRLADLLRHLTDDDRVKAKPAEFSQWLLDGSKQVESLEEGIVQSLPVADLSARFKVVVASCKDCHTKYRD